MTLVGNKSGRRKLLWGPLFKLTVLLMPLGGGMCAGAYAILTGRWSLLAAWLGLGGGFCIVLVILLVNLLTPIHRLPFVR